MNKLGDVVFCVDCDHARSQGLLNGLSQAGAAQDGPPRNGSMSAAAELATDHDADDDLEFDEAGAHAAGEASEGVSQDAHADEGSDPPRRMATKKDANGDPLCSACLDERQSRRRAEFMLTDERRTVVHWPRKGGRITKHITANGRASNATGEKQLALDAPLGEGLADFSRRAEAEAEARAEAESTELFEVNGSSGDAAGAGANAGSLSKAAFVRSLPATMAAKEVIARARKLGFSLTPSYVYVIRSNAVRADIRAATHGKNAKNGHAAKLSPVQDTGKRGRNGKALAAANGRDAQISLLNPDKRRGRQQTQARVNGHSNGHALEINGSAAARVSEVELKVKVKPKTKAELKAELKAEAQAKRATEQRFMWLATELGFFRTQQLIDRLRTRLRSAVSRDRRAPRRGAAASASAAL